MAIPASTVPTALGYLQTQIVAQVNDPSVLVSFGQPSKYLPEGIIGIGAAVRQNQQWHALVGSGQTGAQHEDYDIEVVVSVFGAGSEEASQPCMNRAYTLAAAVDTVVRTDPTLGALCQVSVPSRHDMDLRWEYEDKGWVCEIRITVAVTMAVI